jgi:cob(I)alamin adenosyltransferase
MASVATKTGDDGTTGTLFGDRVPKSDPRVSACGSIDELNAALGMVRAFGESPALAEEILRIQHELVTVMGELAIPADKREQYLAKGFAPVTAEMVDCLTARIDDLEQNHKLSFRHWATPGATRGSATLDLARTVCRRAEREAVALREQGLAVNGEIIRYLNRLSDLCWLLARYVETVSGAG